MRKLLCLSLFGLALCSCVTVPNTESCMVAGKLSAGGICAETLTDKTREMTFEEFMDFLEAQPERPDPKNPGKTLPPHGAAICQSATDYGKVKTVLEEACRELGSKCSYETQEVIKSMDRAVVFKDK